MTTATPQSGAGFRAWYRRQSRIGRISFILTAAIAMMLLLGLPWHLLKLIFLGPIIVCVLVLSPLLIILLYRWVTRRLLWKVRNRLIVTYALMSLAPVVLCLTLFAIASYIFGGQFATNTALTLLGQASTELREETASLALVYASKPTHEHDTSAASEPNNAANNAAPLWIASVNASGKLQPLIGPDGGAVNPFIGQSIPLWLHPGFHGIIGVNNHLYLCSFDSIPQSGRPLSVLGIRPLDKPLLDTTAANLGRVLLIPLGKNRTGNKISVDVNDNDSNDKDGVNIILAPRKGKQSLSEAIQNAQKQAQEQDNNDETFDRVDGGVLPPRHYLFDPPVVFSAPLTVTSWQTGDPLRSVVVVFSRPSILYTRLFSTTNGLGTLIRLAIASIAIFFALLELFALLMAAGLSRTITRSVAELYRGTREIDSGNFAHRIVIKRRDQLGALANSFNGMTASIVDLMVQQREKERLLSELSIAREVQANLFPHSPVALPGFEIHAVCQPARTVSGDYFDFIFGRHGNDLYVALGDISGKGISAALLMASLHSAVRAFGLSSSNGVSADGTRPSPAALLELLNKHIFASTRPEKYATLFLGYYDSATRKLTYSNGGHLAPIILSADGSVKHLDCGGPPVGLLDGAKYCEDVVELHSGDLLMAFSDGLTEPEQNDEQFGEERLFDYIREHRGDALPTLATNTMKCLQQWIGNHEQPDDMTLLLARQL
jgi:sigma-B regulation protein RsbU (phosphoserine phosphatase)